MMEMMLGDGFNLLLEDLRAAERMKGCPSTPPSALKYQDDGAGDGDDDGSAVYPGNGTIANCDHY